MMSLTQSEAEELKKLIDSLDNCEKSIQMIQDQLKVQDDVLQKIQEGIESKLQLAITERDSLESEFDDLNPFKMGNDERSSGDSTSELDDLNPFKTQPTNKKALETVRQSGDNASKARFMTSEIFAEGFKAEKKQKSKSKLLNKVLFWKGKKNVENEAVDKEDQFQESHKKSN